MGGSAAGQAETGDRLPGDEVLGDDLANLGGPDPAVPNVIGVYDDDGRLIARELTPSHRDQHIVIPEPVPPELGIQ